MEILPIHTRLIKPGEDYLEIIFQAMKNDGLTFEDGDILVLSGKAVATSEGRVVDLKFHNNKEVWKEGGGPRDG